MIINGGSRSNGGWFAQHLLNTKDNDRVEVMDIRGLAADQVGAAFQEMQAVASGTKCTNYFYHANLNPRDTEHLTAAEWVLAVERLESNLGLAGQARVVVEHEKKGRVHRHVIWSRIDVERMKAIRMDDDYAIHQRTARELEQAFDLERGRSVLGVERDGPRPARRPQSWEMFRGQQSGMDPNQIRADMTRLWGSTTHGATFATALEAEGYLLAKGARRDFCVIDPAGDAHSLARRLSGVKAAAVRDRLADLDRDALPSVAEGRALQTTRIVAHEAERTRRGVQLETLSVAGALHKAAWSTQVPVLDLPHPEAWSPPPTPDDSVTLFQAGQGRAHDARARARLEAQRDAAPSGEPTLETVVTSAGHVAASGIRVASAVVGQVAERLVAVVEGVLDILVPPPPRVTSRALLGDAASRRAYVAQQVADQQAQRALERIAADMAQGRALSRADVQAMPYDELVNIRDRGDEVLRALVRAREQTREAERRRSGGRERSRERDR